MTSQSESEHGAPAVLVLNPPSRRYHLTQHIKFYPPGAAEPVDAWISPGILPPPAADAGRIFEVFLRGQGKVGSERDFLLDDIACLISCLLSLGMTPGGIRRRLSAPLDDGRPASIIAAACDWLDSLQREIVGGGE